MSSIRRRASRRICKKKKGQQRNVYLTPQVRESGCCSVGPCHSLAIGAMFQYHIRSGLDLDGLYFIRVLAYRGRSTGAWLICSTRSPKDCMQCLVSRGSSLIARWYIRACMSHLRPGFGSRARAHKFCNWNPKR